MIKFELNKGGSKIEIEKILKRLEKGISSEFKKSGVISIAIVSSSAVKKLNKQYRKKDKATDILTFVLNENDCLGEIILSPKDIARRAKAMGKTLQETAAFLIVHGILHIMGYTHKKNHDTAKMESKEKKLLKKLNL